jgi:hypothetical protein
MTIFALKSIHKVMADNFNDFLSLPCWFTIPLVAAYLFLLGYVVYLLWQLRSQP